mmetsp:Transcript_72846/g.126454  ORF Transcript_72846/g.126454 Transcript_72846/m.126454 type:complete len:140 (+) Transcript_72846:104-523(+)
MKQCLLLICAVVAAEAALRSRYPVYAPGSGESADTCGGISCKPLDCKTPFKYVSAASSGTCCPLCLADSISVPEDRSWTASLSGGVGMNNNADSILCRGVMCPPLHCPETEQSFDGRCCTKCSSAAATTPADLAAAFKS